MTIGNSYMSAIELAILDYMAGTFRDERMSSRSRAIGRGGMMAQKMGAGSLYRPLPGTLAK